MKTYRTVRREEEVREEELQEAIWDMAEAVHPAVIFLSLDEDPTADYDGIKRINALKWLMGEV